MSEDDAADLVQDVLTKLTSQLPTFSYDPNRKNFRGWLKTITFNACRDRQRRPKAADGQSTLLSELADDSALSELWEAEFQRNLVNHALRIMKTDFNETTWKACWETAVEGRAAKDVAAELGMTEPAVYMAKSRVLRRLRDELKELLE
jgi:RNA polymerase sigma-70 factor (ECF subfamily)